MFFQNIVFSHGTLFIFENLRFYKFLDLVVWLLYGYYMVIIWLLYGYYVGYYMVNDG